MTTEIVYGFLVKVSRELLDGGKVFNNHHTYNMYEIDFAGVNDNDSFHSDSDNETDYVLIGRTLATGEYQYSGVLEVPEVDQHVKDNVAQLQTNNVILQGLKPKLYVYSDSLS